MTLVLNHGDVCEVATMAMAIEAMEHVYGLAGDGQTGDPRRYDIALTKGWLRLMVIEAQGLGVFGYKAMNLFPGVGVRYAVHLYDGSSGALAAIVDAKQVTALRTAACAAVATDRLAPARVERMAMIGTGAEARTQLLAMDSVRPAATVAVHSRSEANVARFIEEMAPQVAAELTPCTSVEDAVAGAQLVVLATKSDTPVLRADHLRSGVHVNSVGAARLDQRELDSDVFAVVDLTVCDEVELVSREAGDVAQAVVAGTFVPERAMSLAELVRSPVERDDSAITLFKSVGSALQDLALAGRVVEAARAKGLGRELAGFLQTK